MNLGKINNLVELFFEQSKVQDKNKILLSSLKNPRKQFSWKRTSEYIINFSKDIKNHTQNGDRCLLISENRPEWFISDLAIMLSNSITVPTYTTYLERDYKYIIPRFN